MTNGHTSKRNSILRLFLKAAGRPLPLIRIGREVGMTAQQARSTMRSTGGMFKNTTAGYVLTPAGERAARSAAKRQVNLPVVVKKVTKYKACSHPLAWEDQLWREIQDAQCMEVRAALDAGFADAESISAAVILPVSVVKRRMEEVKERQG